MRGMTPYFASAVAAAMLCCGCGGAKSSAPAAGRTVELTDAFFVRGSSDTLNFGRLHEGEIAVRSITLHNASAEPTVIVTHEVSCGCVTLDYERRPILPDASATVDFTFDSRGERGWQMKLVTLRFGEKAVPLRIFVEAEVE